MNRHRVEQIRKEMNKRRKQYGMDRDRKLEETFFHKDESDHSVFESDPKESFHPLFKKEVFFMKIFASAILVLLVAIIFQSPSPKMEDARVGIKKALEREFQFAVVADWYEDKFGQPLALFPVHPDPKQNTTKSDYAMPVAGKILEPFSDERQGIIMETGTGEEVEAITAGTVTFAGKKEGIGNTVIIQHPDYSETWYGKLGQISVKAYEKVKAGQMIGNVSAGEDGETGEFYFAIKQHDTFVDPIQVMKFE
ncbi:M23 family metallopeptidase [Lederbergia sp. NSJ-179]|uniref:M23 family metallopeptidase n=1 Tax=Lederbergia sp. NSJ-179 TaxID=2931402 RepID=UPI001FD23861|nr:M23 family metallopeptidase [Lederbergia sp. NSJ-179]MCJ7839905.1 M23 family metallopeptidase [Lederbergia sp. NSJ-179]